MSIEKLDFEKVIKEEIPYTLISTKVIQKLADPLALAIWVYLASLPPDWKVNKTHIQNHFVIGICKAKKIFSYLKKSNLIEYIQPKNSDGSYGEMAVNVLCGDNFNPAGIESIPPDKSACFTGGIKPVRPGNRSNGKMTHTKETNKQNKDSKQNKHKSFCKSEEQKASNEQKHEWAPMKNESAAIEENEVFKRCPMPDSLRKQMQALKNNLGGKR